MTPRTLKEVAQAGLVLGFEWISKDKEVIFIRRSMPRWCTEELQWESKTQRVPVQIADYPDLPPEQSLLRLRDIVEDKA